jgi:hypothetical protein
MHVSGIDAQDTANMNDFEGVFSTLGFILDRPVQDYFGCLGVPPDGVAMAHEHWRT